MTVRRWLIDKSALVRIADSVDADEWSNRIERGLEVQLLLADTGGHPGPSIPDLLIAATADLAGLTVLHVDKDFDAISELTGQPTERLSIR